MQRHVLRGSAPVLLLLVGVSALLVVPSRIHSDEPPQSIDQRKPLEAQTVGAEAVPRPMTAAEREKMDMVHLPTAGLLAWDPPVATAQKSREPYPGMTDAERAKLARALQAVSSAADVQKRSFEPYMESEPRPAGAEGRGVRP